MKKIFAIIFIALLTLQMQGQNDKNFIPPPNTGMRYMCVNTKKIPVQTFKNQLILKITNPKWRVEKDTFSIPNLNEKEEVTKVIATKPGNSKWYIETLKCPSVDSTNCLGFLHLQKYESIKPKTLLFKKDTFHIVEIEKRTRPASLSIIAIDSVNFDGMEKVELEEHSFIYFKDTTDRVVYVVPDSGRSFYWDKTPPSCMPPVKIKPRTIKQIQEKLKEKGYDCPVDNVFGKETKAALIQFQKDNGIIDWGSSVSVLFPPSPPSENDLKLKSLNEW